MIKMQNYSFSYDEQKVFENLNLSIAKGKKIALLGSNGSGKSTLLRVLAGLYFGKGEYLFDGRVVNKKSIKTLRKELALLFQNPDSMIFNPTVYDEIAFSLKAFGFEEIEQRVQAVAKTFRIEHLLQKSPLQLSGGQKQKILLAALLAYEPKLLLLDEPTSAMDPKSTGWLIDFLLDLDTTLVVATHDIAFAYESCEEAIVLDNSHTIIYQGAIEELMEKLDILEQANLIHKHKHKHKSFYHSHYHLHT
jgi:cobalt/nickel transport system ATP-binding protein